MSAYKHILIPTDFGPAAKDAIEHAIGLVDGPSTRLTLLHSFEYPTFTYSEMAYLDASVVEAIESGARVMLDAALVELRKRVPQAQSILHGGAPVDFIMSVIKNENVDLVVMGTHGYRGLRHALLGSVAEKVVRLSPVPVLTVHAHTQATVIGQVHAA